MAGTWSSTSDQGSDRSGSGYGDASVSSGDQCVGRNSLFVGQFKKTTLCKHFLHGFCIYGTSCEFAHSRGELQHRPDLRKTKLCPGFMRKQCLAGASCDFAHGYQELRHTHTFYKSAICGEWAKHGRCLRGNRCRYAHGVQDVSGHYNDNWECTPVRPPPPHLTAWTSKTGNEYTPPALSYEPMPPLGDELDAYLMSEMLGEISQILAENYNSDSIPDHQQKMEVLGSVGQGQDNICSPLPKFTADLSAWNSAVYVNNSAYVTPIDSVASWSQNQRVPSADAGVPQVTARCS